jgi:hypothetical protein
LISLKFKVRSHLKVSADGVLTFECKNLAISMNLSSSTTVKGWSFSTIHSSNLFLYPCCENYKKKDFNYNLFNKLNSEIYINKHTVSRVVPINLFIGPTLVSIPSKIFK